MKHIVSKFIIVILSTLCINLSSYAANDNQDVTANEAQDATTNDSQNATVNDSQDVTMDDSQEIDTLSKNSGLQPNVIELALKARQWASDHATINKDILAVVDYTKVSTEPRLYVFDLKTDDLLMKIRVAHGRNTGTPEVATSFSDQPQSKKSVLGVLVTGDTYNGEHGYSRRLIGLEPQINDLAYERAIVIHSAAYVNPSFVGRSWGCLAVNPADASKLISTLVPGSVVFAYASAEDHDTNITSEHI